LLRQTAHRSLVATLQAGLRAWGVSAQADAVKRLPTQMRSGLCFATSQAMTGQRPSHHRCGGSAGFSPASRL